MPEGPGVWLCAEHDVDALGRSLVAALERQTPSSPAHVVAHHDVARVIPRLEAIYAQAAETGAATRMMGR